MDRGHITQQEVTLKTTGFTQDELDDLQEQAVLTGDFVPYLAAVEEFMEESKALITPADSKELPWFDIVDPNEQTSDNSSEESIKTVQNDGLRIVSNDNQDVLTPEMRIRQHCYRHRWPRTLEETEKLSRKYGGYAPLRLPVEAFEDTDKRDITIQGFNKGAPVIFGPTPFYNTMSDWKVWAGPDLGTIFLPEGPVTPDELQKWHQNYLNTMTLKLEHLAALKLEEDTSKMDDFVDMVQVAAEVRDDPQHKRLLWSNEHFEVRASELGGLGVFAVCDLPEGVVLLAEEPLMRLKTIGMELFPTYKALDKGRKAAFDALHGFSIRAGSRPIEDIAHANGFEVPGTGIAILAIGSRFNHKCELRRNVVYSYDAARHVMVFTSKKAAKTGDELCINYGGSQMELYKRYGFKCNCGACPGVRITDWDQAISNIGKLEYGNAEPDLP